jgi:hypothetical protein
LLYWYKSTTADTEGEGGAGGGTQFTCFTGTKVQLLTLRERAGQEEVLSLLALLVQKYKSTNTDLQEEAPPQRSCCGRRIESRTYADVYADVC